MNHLFQYNNHIIIQTCTWKKTKTKKPLPFGPLHPADTSRTLPLFHLCALTKRFNLYTVEKKKSCVVSLTPSFLQQVSEAVHIGAAETG